MGIAHNSERLQKLASDILDIARIESNTFRLTKKSLNLNSMISNIVKDYVKRIGQRKAHDIARSISTDVNAESNNDKKNKKDGKTMEEAKLVFQSKINEEESILVEADEERLTQVIDNILDNAFKFTDADGRVTVTLEKQEETQSEQLLQLGEQTEQKQQQKKLQQHAIITIKDTGTGIDPQILPKLFSKFATKSYRGTGLGLYISRNIVEAHGGKIWAENNPDGMGATFTIALPLLLSKEQPKNRLDSKKDYKKAIMLSSVKTIMVP
jgi:signal transduction histidine kinase